MGKMCSNWNTLEQNRVKHIQVAGGPGGQEDQGHGVVLQDQGEEYQQPINSIIISYSRFSFRQVYLELKVKNGV